MLNLYVKSKNTGKFFSSLISHILCLSGSNKLSRSVSEKPSSFPMLSPDQEDGTSNYTSDKKKNITEGAQIFFGALSWSIAVYLVIRHSGTLPGNDVYFHIQLAEIMKSHGIVLDSFPWATHSVWNNAFFDKDWLFHVFLIPFLFLGKIAGGKAALLTIVFLIGLAWGFLFKALKCRYIFAALLLTLFCSGYAFFGRLVLLRAHLFSVFFIAVCLICIIKKWYLSLTATIVLYSLSYTGSWQIIPIAIIFDIVKFFQKKYDDDKGLRYCTIWAVLGIFIGFCVNPYYPANISGGILQNITVLKSGWLGIPGTKIILGEELYAVSITKLFTVYIPVIVILFGTVYHCINSKKKLSNNFTVIIPLGFLSFIYLVLTMFTVKFTDYLVPFTVAFAVSAWNIKLPFKGKKSIFFYIILFFFILFGYFSITNLRKDTIQAQPRYYGAVQWLNNNIIRRQKGEGIDKISAPGLVVFTGEWSDTPALFYGAPQFRYLVFLDPNFMYAYSPAKYNLWKKISDGRVLCPAIRIYNEFNSKIVFLTKHKKRLFYALIKSPYAKLMYTGTEGESIFVIDAISDSGHLR